MAVDLVQPILYWTTVTYVYMGVISDYVTSVILLL